MFALGACGDDEESTEATTAATSAATTPVTDEAAAARRHRRRRQRQPDVLTLVAAVGAAGLVETLQGPGPFTVFAPTNDAFAALPEGLVDALLLPENKDALVQILTYHVVAGQVIGCRRRRR